MFVIISSLSTFFFIIYPFITMAMIKSYVWFFFLETNDIELFQKWCIVGRCMRKLTYNPIYRYDVEKKDAADIGWVVGGGISLISAILGIAGETWIGIILLSLYWFIMLIILPTRAKVLREKAIIKRLEESQ